jgi:hypothetical protein
MTCELIATSEEGLSMVSGPPSEALMSGAACCQHVWKRPKMIVNSHVDETVPSVHITANRSISSRQMNSFNHFTQFTSDEAIPSLADTQPSRSKTVTTYPVLTKDLEWRPDSWITISGLQKRIEVN